MAKTVASIRKTLGEKAESVRKYREEFTVAVSELRGEWRRFADEEFWGEVKPPQE